MTAPQNSNSNLRMFFGPTATRPSPQNVSQGELFHATDVGTTFIAMKTAGGVGRWDPVDGITGPAGTTTDAITPALFALTPTVVGAYSIVAEVQAFDAANNLGIWFEINHGFRATNGPPSVTTSAPTAVTMLNAAVIDTGGDGALAAATAAFSNSGATLVLTMTGVAVHTLTWTYRIRISGNPV